MERQETKRFTKVGSELSVTSFAIHNRSNTVRNIHLSVKVREFRCKTLDEIRILSTNKLEGEELKKSIQYRREWS